MRATLFAVSFALGTVLTAHVAMAGVVKIERYGKSSFGEQIYRIHCSNGHKPRYWWHNNQWWGGFGAVGLRGMNLQQLAEYKCR